VKVHVVYLLLHANSIISRFVSACTICGYKEHNSGEDPDERNDRFDVSYVRSTCLLHLLLFVANAWLRHLGVLPDANTCTWQESLYPASLSHVVYISMDKK